MKSLILYLPKDVTNIVLDYLYKPDIKGLNEEYHFAYEINDYDNSINHVCGFKYNYRPVAFDLLHCISNIKIYDNFEIYGKYIPLPKNYRYSSACNLLDRYRYK